MELMPSSCVLFIVFLYFCRDRAVAPGVLDSEMFGLQTLQHIMRVTRSWDSTMSMIPKGGEVIWGGSDWSPEEGFRCSGDKDDKLNGEDVTDNKHATSKDLGPHGKPMAHYGRLVSFGKDVAELAAHRIKRKPFKVCKSGFLKLVFSSECRAT